MVKLEISRPVFNSAHRKPNKFPNQLILLKEINFLSLKNFVLSLLLLVNNKTKTKCGSIFKG